MTDAPPTPEDERVIKHAARLHLYHTLASHPEIRNRRVLPSMVSDYVDGAHPDTDGAIAKALRTELPLRRLYNHLLGRRSMAREIVQVAASTQDESKLVLDGATLHWYEMPGRERLILVLQLGEDVRAQPSARPVLHLEWDEDVDRIVFLDIADGTAQYVLAADDRRIMRLMADAKRTKPATRYRIVLH